MPRRKRKFKRELLPDYKYHDPMVTKLIHTVMRRGKKSLAERIVYGAFERIAHQTKDDPMKVYKKALSNLKPQVEVKSRRIGGSNYQVPVEVLPHRKNSLALRWLVQYAKARKGRSMIEKLSAELMDAAENRGEAIKKREDVHRMAEANKAFAHFRW